LLFSTALFIILHAKEFDESHPFPHASLGSVIIGVTTRPSPSSSGTGSVSVPSESSSISSSVLSGLITGIVMSPAPPIFLWLKYKTFDESSPFTQLLIVSNSKRATILSLRYFHLMV